MFLYFFLEYKSKEVARDDLLKNFLDIFYSIDNLDYIFDFYIDNQSIINYNNLITLNDLKKSFDNYSYKELRYFLNNTQKEYLDENIRQNIIIRNSILYMIYICFDIYRSFLKAYETITDINNSLSLKNNYFAKWQFQLFKERVKMKKESSFIIFNRYNKLLEKFFDILSNYKK